MIDMLKTSDCYSLHSDATVGDLGLDLGLRKEFVEQSNFNLF